MDEIKNIMRQFRHGAMDSEWKQFIKSIKISNIHGWTGQELILNFPVVAIVGENGIGKSTFLKAAVCAYKNKNRQTFYPSKMFVSTRWDETGLENATIEYKVRRGDQEVNLRWKKQTTGDLHRNKENLNAMYFSWIFLEHFHWMQLLDMQKWLNLPTKKWER